MVTIVIPTYNRASIILRTLDSVAKQSYKNWECLVVDDHSTDNTKTVVEEYCRKDSRFLYLVNEGKKGAQGARNTGLNHALFDWVIFFDSDNIMHSDMLESMVDEIENNKEQFDVLTCFSNVINVYREERINSFDWVCEGNIHDKLFTGECYVDYNSAVIRKRALFEMDAIDEDCPSMQEWDTHIRLSETARYHTIQKVLVDYYVGGKDAISSDNKREIVGRLYILKKYQKEWKRHKESHIGYVKAVYSLIQQHTSILFQIVATLKLIIYSPSVQWINMKRRVKRFIHRIDNNT